MPKTIHIAYDIASLLAASDQILNESISGGTVEELREALKEMLDDGIEYLTIADCDNKRPNGSCAGHKEPCTNCGVALPEGCSGLFKEDSSCQLSAAEKLDNLTDSIVKDIIDMPDDEIIAEALERLGSPEAVHDEAERLRGIALNAVKIGSKRKLVSELSCGDLDYWVSKIEGVKPRKHVFGWLYQPFGIDWDTWSPTKIPNQAYPIIERDRISVGYYFNTWNALIPTRIDCDMTGETALIAAMRCKVASVYGEYVDG